MPDEDQNNSPDKKFKQKLNESIERLTNHHQYTTTLKGLTYDVAQLVQGWKKNPGPPETHIVIAGGDEAPGEPGAILNAAFIRSAINYLKIVSFPENAHIIVISHAVPSQSDAGKNPSLVYIKHMKALLQKKFKGRYYFDVRDFDKSTVYRDTKGKYHYSFKYQMLTKETLAQVKGNVRSVVMFSHGGGVPYIAFNKARKLGEDDLKMFEKMSYDKDAFALFVACSCSAFAKKFFDKTKVTSIGSQGKWFYFKDTKGTMGMTAALGASTKLFVQKEGVIKPINITKKITKFWTVRKKTKKGTKKIHQWNLKKFHAITLLKKLHEDGVRGLISKP